MDTRENTRLGSFGANVLEKRKDALLQLVKTHVDDVHLMLLSVRTQLVEVHLVALDGVR